MEGRLQLESLFDKCAHLASRGLTGGLLTHRFSLPAEEHRPTLWQRLLHTMLRADLPRDPHSARDQRLAIAGLLSASLAHDLNNVLTLLLASIESAPRSDPASAEALLSGARVACERAQALSRRLLDVVREEQAAVVKVPVNLTRVAEEVASLIRPILPAHGSIQVHAESASVFALGDAIEIYQGLLNVCVNAAQATSQRGQIDVFVEWMTKSKNAGSLGPSAKIVVRDLGVGLSTEAVKQLENPTREPKPGRTGLGLSILRRMVDRHGARLRIRSEPGFGTHVEIVFPGVEAEVS